MRLSVAILLLLLCYGCQKYEWDEPEAEEEQTPVIYPIGHGRGTQQYPLTVADMQAGKAAEGQPCWVMGYAVGSTYRTMKNALFSVPTTWAQNILLSDDSLCADVADCIPIQLSTQHAKDNFSLVAHADMHAQAVVLYGVAGTYFRQLGLRQVIGGYWLPGFDLNQINIQPTYWEEFDKHF